MFVDVLISPVSFLIGLRFTALTSVVSSSAVPSCCIVHADAFGLLLHTHCAWLLAHPVIMIALLGSHTQHYYEKAHAVELVRFQH